VFGAGAEKRHKAFKAFFGVSDPWQAPPPKHTHPNHKIDHFLAWVQSVSISAWDMGRAFACDEQTISFKGNHSDKQ